MTFRSVEDIKQYLMREEKVLTVLLEGASNNKEYYKGKLRVVELLLIYIDPSYYKED